MNRAELSEGDLNAHRLRVFRVVFPRFEIRAVWIWLAGAWQRRLNHRTGGGYHANTEALHGNRVARFGNGMPSAAIELRISALQKRVGQFAWLHVRAVIDEFP